MKKIFLILLTLITASLVFAQNAWINEFHYDNSGADEGEMIEVVVELAPGDELSNFSK